MFKAHHTPCAIPVCEYNDAWGFCEASALVRGACAQAPTSGSPRLRAPPAFVSSWSHFKPRPELGAPPHVTAAILLGARMPALSHTLYHPHFHLIATSPCTHLLVPPQGLPDLHAQ
jgi:hypothetical protein